MYHVVTERRYVIGYREVCSGIADPSYGGEWGIGLGLMSGRKKKDGSCGQSWIQREKLARGCFDVRGYKNKVNGGGVA